jgi:hypothetical protein
LTKFFQKGDILDKEDRLAERADDREDKYLQIITKARNEAEKDENDKLVTELDIIYEEVTDKIEDINNEQKQKVLDSQLEALEKEIKVYGGAIEKVKKLVVK